MDLENVNGFSLRDLNKINVILGKNGCGKSYALKQIEQGLNSRKNDFGEVRYISPERGGVLNYDAGVEQSISQQVEWLTKQRRRNRSENFRQQSAALFRRLENLVLRHIEEEHTKDDYVPVTFNATVDRINTLLERVKVVRDHKKAFVLKERDSNRDTSAEEISSGEAELISLGIELLAFAHEAAVGKENVILIDEPDVHLHPDLQDRLARFITEVTSDRPVTVILATHSTALLYGLAAKGDARIAFMRRGDSELSFKSVTDVDKAILPIFGAHPLSNVFNEAPVLLIEGEDDERIWQQAVRSSNGQVRVFPCVAESVDRLAEYETEINNIIEAVYDDAHAYSLRDRDENPTLIDDVGHVVRMRLACRAAENLMLSDDVLAFAGVTWDGMKTKIVEWTAANSNHLYSADMQRFAESGFDRQNFDLKPMRNILIGLISNKPWEVLVGQSIASMVRLSVNYLGSPGSLQAFLGAKVCVRLLNLQEPENEVAACMTSESDASEIRAS